MSEVKTTTEPEEWRAVVGYEGYYEVSNLGRVKSVHRRVQWQGTLTTVRERILALCDNGAGHKYVVLAGGSRESRQHGLVHRLVLEAFVGPAPEGTECRHFPDRDPSNNRLGNLQWGTRKQNMHDKYAHDTHLHGERSPLAKLTNNQVRRIVRMLKSGQFMQKEIAAKFKIAAGRVQAIASRKAWRRISEELD